MLQMIHRLVHLALLATLLFSGPAWRLQAWLMRPASDGTPARLWTVMPVFVALLMGLVALVELTFNGRNGRLISWLDQLAQRGAMFFVGAAWVVSWQQLLPTAWAWLWPVVAGVIVSVLVERPRSVVVMLVVTIWIGIAIVLCARFIPWWTRGTPLYVLWQAMAISAWAWLGEAMLSRAGLSDAATGISRGSVWWGNLMPRDRDRAITSTLPLASAPRS
jgi:hypothetical protein